MAAVCGGLLWPSLSCFFSSSLASSCALAPAPAAVPALHHHRVRRSKFRELRTPWRSKRLDCISQLTSFPVWLSRKVDTELHVSAFQLQDHIVHGAIQLGQLFSADQEAFRWWIICLPALLWYLSATPGSILGLLDMIYEPVHSYTNKSFSADEVDVGRQIGEGSFGIVYEGYIARDMEGGTQKNELHVVLKKAKPRMKGATDMQNAEVHMNLRMQRTAPNSCARFLGTMEVSSLQAKGRLTEGLWLIWQFQGDRTLDYYIKQKTFPENLAPYLCKETVRSDGLSHLCSSKQSCMIQPLVRLLKFAKDDHFSNLPLKFR